MARYTALRWHPKTIPIIYDDLPTLGPIDREILLMRLANTLEDLLDLGILYCPYAEVRRQHSMQFGPILIDMAEQLNSPKLATEFARVLRIIATADIPKGLRNRRVGVFLVAPESYRRRLRLVLRQDLSRRLSHWHSKLLRQFCRVCLSFGVGAKN